MPTRNVAKKQHPLLVPAVVLEVLNYLPTPELKCSFRIVCKVWYEEASRVLRKRRALKVYLANYDTLNEYFRASKAQKEMFNEFHLGVRLHLKDPRIQRFFSQFGRVITSLDLGKSQWPNSSLRKILAENLPNLEVLSMQLIAPKGSSSSNGDVSQAHMPASPASTLPEPETDPKPVVTENNFRCEKNAPNFQPQPQPQPHPHPHPQSHPQQSFPQPADQKVYNNNNNYTNNTWSTYPTPPPIPGDYYNPDYNSYNGSQTHSQRQWNGNGYDGQKYDYGHGQRHGQGQGQGQGQIQTYNYSGQSYQTPAADWYTQTPGVGEWQSSYTATESTHYATTPAQQYNQTYSYVNTTAPQGGEWYYSHYRREWCWNTKNPTPAPAPTPYVHPPVPDYTYNRNYGYQYQHQQQQQQQPPAQNFGYSGQELDRWEPLTPPDPSYNDQFYWNNHTSFTANLLNPNPIWSSYNPPQPQQPVPPPVQTFYPTYDLKFQKYNTPPTPNSLSPSLTSSTENNQNSSLPKLKSLNFTIDYALSWTQEQQEGMKTFFRDLMQGMPNLEKISCSKYPTNNVDDPTAVIARESNLLPLLDVISEPNGPQLSHLKYLDIPLKNWNKIHELGERFPLEVLEWNIPKHLMFTTFQQFLHKLSSTLTRLEINFSSANPKLQKYLSRDFTGFKELEKLKHLKLIGYNGGSLGFVLLIPSLETLVLDVAKSKPDFEVLFDSTHFKNRMSESQALESLQSLTICNSKNPGLKELPLSANVIRRISKAFTGLVSLDMEFIGDEALRAIFTSFPELETLKLSDGLFTDAFFIGLSPKSFASYMKQKQRQPKTKDPVREFCYIGTLRYLKKLDVCSKYMTDQSVFYGILHCWNLTSLTIRAYGITNASLKRIADEMLLVFFKTVSCHQLTTFGANYVKEKMTQAHLSLNEYEGPLNEEETNRLLQLGSGYKILLKRVKVIKM